MKNPSSDSSDTSAFSKSRPDNQGPDIMILQSNWKNKPSAAGLRRHHDTLPPSQRIMQAANERADPSVVFAIVVSFSLLVFLVSAIRVMLGCYFCYRKDAIRQQQLEDSHGPERAVSIDSTDSHTQPTIPPLTSGPLTTHNTITGQVHDVVDTALRDRVVRAILPVQTITSSNVLYDPEDNSHQHFEADFETCSICIETFQQGDEVVTSLCKHIFHQDCILEWVGKNKMDCPVCRQHMWDPTIFGMLKKEIAGSEDFTLS